MNEEEPGFGCLKTGYYFPLCYDAYHDVFWRVQQGPLDGHGVAGKPFSIMCISTDLMNSAEYVILSCGSFALPPFLLDTAA